MYKVAVVGDQHITDVTPRCRKDYYPDAILNKIDQILNDNDIFIGLGDLFDSASIGEQTLHKFMSLLLYHRQRGKQFYTILGNHDLFKHNTNLLDKTSLGICLLDGLVKRLTSLTVGDVLFQEIPFVKNNPELPKEFHPEFTNVLLGHYFFENNFCLEFSLTREQIEKTFSMGLDKHTYILLGHDHAPYPKQFFCDYKVSLSRLGSLCRNTANDYNFDRIPKYTQFVFNESMCLQEVNEVELVNIPLDVFLPKVIPVEKEDFTLSFDMKQLCESFGTSSVEVVRLSACLAELQAKEPVIDNIKRIYENLSMEFK